MLMSVVLLPLGAMSESMPLPEAMSMSVTHAATMGQSGPVVLLQLKGMLMMARYHRRPCGCLWAVLPPRDMLGFVVLL